MKRIYLLGLILLGACNSFQNTKTVADNNTDTLIANVPDNLQEMNGCYLSILRNDSAFLKLSINKGLVKGTLNFNYSEKDKNTGTISGRIQDSLLLADYTFMSEGKTSVREVAFKIGADRLVEGYGDLNMKGDTVRFIDISQLKFQEGSPFIKVKCQ